MRVLGIESTAHTIGIGLYDSQKDYLIHHYAFYGFSPKGFLPNELAEHHSKHFVDVLKKVFNDSGLSIEDIDVIAVSQGPGIPQPLAFGVAIAKFMAEYFDKPIVGVNHPLAHVKIAEYFSGWKDYVTLYLSGGNSQILAKEGEFSYRIMGETLDMGMGNLFDSFARAANISPPSGAQLERIAKEGRYIELPYYIKGMNFSFSGLYTAALRALKNNKLEDVAYSLMHNAFVMTMEAVERAMYVKEVKRLLLTGGVAQNDWLFDMAKTMAEENGFEVFRTEDEFNRDNGAMIAYTGYLLYKEFGGFDIKKFHHLPYYRIDQVLKIVNSLKIAKD